MARSRHSLVFVVAALLGMLAQLGLSRSWGFVPPRTGPPIADSSSAAETYMVWSAQVSRDHLAAAAPENLSTQGFANVGRVCATAMLMFALVLGVMVPPSHARAKTAEQLVREALKNPRGSVQDKTLADQIVQVQEQKQIQKAPANLQTDTSETAKKEPAKPVSAEQSSEKVAATVQKITTKVTQDTTKAAQDTTKEAQEQERAAALEEAAKQQRQKAAKLLVEEKQKEKAAANLQKLEKKKSAERLVREALENAQAEKIKQSSEPKEQQTTELQQLAAKQAQEKEQDEKQDALRLKILKDLQKRKADAEKAAAESEAIALKIEQLAKDARAAAEAAKQMASALR